MSKLRQNIDLVLIKIWRQIDGQVLIKITSTIWRQFQVNGVDAPVTSIGRQIYIQFRESTMQLAYSHPHPFHFCQP